jgi:broad specificity phosphatase PhoE
MDVPTRLLLIRHAHTDPGSRLCGSFDLPLSHTGRAQVQALLAHRGTCARPDALYTSTLGRALEVAAALARVWGIPPRSTDAAREIHCGSVDGMRLEEVQTRYPDLWARNSAQADDDFAWPAGESYRSFRGRILAGFASIASEHSGQRVVIVTHAGVISQVLGTIRGRPPRVWDVDRPEPFSATEVTWANGRPQAVLEYNNSDWYREGRLHAGRRVATP